MQSQERSFGTELSTQFLNMLGLCARAGRLISGEAAVLQAVRSASARIVFADASASDNTRKRFRDACAFRNVPLLFYEGGGGGDAARAVGKPAHKLFAVSDEGFAKQLFSMLEPGDFTGNLGVEI